LRTIPLAKGRPIPALCSLILSLVLTIPPLQGHARGKADQDNQLCDHPLANPDAGIPACTRLIARDDNGENSAGYYNKRGVGNVAKGNFINAIADFTSALDRKPNFVDALKNRGIVYQILGRYGDAITDFNRALQLDDKQAAIYNARGAALFKKDEFDLAIADYDKAIELDSNYAKAYVNRGQAFAAKRQFDRAINDFHAFIKLVPNDPLGYTNRGDARKEKGDYDGAIDDFNEAILILPDFVAAYIGRGLTYEKRGDLARANADFKKAQDLSEAIGSGFSGAALASQALSELSETTTEEASRNTLKTLAERRAKERERCAEGFTRVDGECQRIPPPAREAEAAPPEQPGHRRKILETGYSFLKDIGGEEPRYGLYSYAILVNASDRSAKFLNSVFGDTQNAIPPVEDTAAAPSQTNVLYIPLKRNKAKEWRKGRKLGKEASMRAVYARNFYDYKMSRALLDHLCALPAEEIKTACNGDLSKGPFIFAYAKPASKVTPVPPPFLFVDLSDVHERAFPDFIAAFKAQVKREDISDRVKIDTLRLKVLSIVLTAADWVTPVHRAIAEVVHPASELSGKDKK
jgi:tetratricopeptide (TPR) repeat protein